MNDVKKSLALMALMLAFGAPAAIAQTGASKGGGIGPAPIGHRQPRPGDVAGDKNLANSGDSISKEDALLDKKIKSICRGC